MKLKVTVTFTRSLVVDSDDYDLELTESEMENPQNIIDAVKTIEEEQTCDADLEDYKDKVTVEAVD